MPKYYNQYRCPGCHTVQGRWMETLKHEYTCCPQLVQNKSGLQQRCKIDNPRSAKAAHAKTVKTRERRARRKRARENTSPLKSVQDASDPLVEPSTLASSSNDDTQAGGLVAVKTIRNKPGKRCHNVGIDGKTHKRKNCKTCLDPNHLFVLTCTVCGNSHDASRKVEEYLCCRRRTRKELNLLSVTIPLNDLSCSLLSKVSLSCGIQSNTAVPVPHVTYVEGLLPDKSHVPVYLRHLKSL